MNVRSLIEKAARLWPTRVAVIEESTQRSVSFTDLMHDLSSVGPWLARLGAAPGDRVALIGDAAYEYLIADYGLMANALVRVPLDPSLTAEELANQVKDAGARHLLFASEFAALATAVQARLGSDVACVSLAVGGGSGDAAQAGSAPPPPDALASLNYTGGTTGQPKAVMLSQANLCAAVEHIVAARGMGPGDVMVNMRPLWPIAAIVVLAHLAAGGTVVLAGRFDSARLLTLLQTHRAAATSLVPTHLARLLKETDPRDYKLDSLRSIDVGGAAIPPELFTEALAAFGPKISVLYGLTEAPWSCYQPASALTGSPAEQAARTRTVGWPMPGYTVKIDAPAGASGEVLVRGPHVMGGYWRHPELTREVLEDGWFHTGDIGLLDESGALAIVGRLKEIIRTGAKSVRPQEVEAALRVYPGVLDVAVIGLPDAEWGEIVAAAVVARAEAAVTAEVLLAHCRQHLAPHKRPKLIRLVDSLPKSHYGKIQSGKLRADLLRSRGSA